MNKSLSSEALELLKELVSIPTVNDPSKGLKPSKEAAEYILEWLQKNEVDAEIVESNGYYSVYEVLGEKPKVMLMAHYDVVPVVYERWKY